MRVSPTGVSATSGVEPISSSRFGATTLRTAFEHVDRRARLAEDLVDAPEQAAALGFDGCAAELLDKLRLATLEPRERQQIGNCIPRAVLEHPFSPLTVKLLAADDLEAGRTGARYEERR